MRDMIIGLSCESHVPASGTACPLESETKRKLCSKSGNEENSSPAVNVDKRSPLLFLTPQPGPGRWWEFACGVHALRSMSVRYFWAVRIATVLIFSRLSERWPFATYSPPPAVGHVITRRLVVQTLNGLIHAPPRGRHSREPRTFHWIGRGLWLPQTSPRHASTAPAFG